MAGDVEVIDKKIVYDEKTDKIHIYQPYSKDEIEDINNMLKDTWHKNEDEYITTNLIKDIIINNASCYFDNKILSDNIFKDAYIMSSIGYFEMVLIDTDGNKYRYNNLDEKKEK